MPPILYNSQWMEEVPIEWEVQRGFLRAGEAFKIGLPSLKTQG